MDFKDFLGLDHIVFYDGECGVCSSAVQFILKKKKVDFYFVSLQSELAKNFLNHFGIEVKMNTLYLYEDGKILDASSAILYILKSCRGAYPLLYYCGALLPKFFRDALYLKVSDNRFKLAARSCVLPRPEEKKFFLA